MNPRISILNLSEHIRKYRAGVSVFSHRLLHCPTLAGGTASQRANSGAKHVETVLHKPAFAADPTSRGVLWKKAQCHIAVAMDCGTRHMRASTAIASRMHHRNGHHFRVQRAAQGNIMTPPSPGRGSRLQAPICPMPVRPRCSLQSSRSNEHRRPAGLISFAQQILPPLRRWEFLLVDQVGAVGVVAAAVGY